LKFTGHLALFSDLDDEYGREFQSKMNTGIPQASMPSAEDAFGASDTLDDDDGVPF
jgi:replicative DNA helicase